MSTSKTPPRKTRLGALKTTTPPTATSKKPVPATAAAPSDTPNDVSAFPNALRKKELVDQVVARTGMKKRDAKPVVEAVLAELGETLAQGRSLVLPPLGRVRINREKKLANGKVMVVKIRQNNPPLTADATPGTGDAKL